MNKRIMKVITLILSCLLLIGAAVGITVAAEETPSVQIVKKNVAYEGAIQLVYLVDTNVEGTVWVEFSDGVTTYQKKAAGTVSLTDGEYASVYSNGIVAKNYRKTITATPYVVDAEGKTVATGEAVEFSAYDYAMARFDGTYSNNQFNLYKALLDYGASVQTVLGYSDATIDELGGWIDEYYNTTITNEATGEVLTYKRGKTAPATDFVADKFAKDKVFLGLYEGEELAVATAGWHKYTVMPGSAAKNIVAKFVDGTNPYEQFTDVTELPGFISNVAGKEAAFVTDPATGSVRYITGADDALTFVQNGAADGDSLRATWNDHSTQVEKIVYDFDVRVEYANSLRTQFLYLKYYSTKSAAAGVPYTGGAIQFQDTNESDNVFEIAGVGIFNYNDWINIRLEFVKVPGEYGFRVYKYFNGVLDSEPVKEGDKVVGYVDFYRIDAHSSPYLHFETRYNQANAAKSNVSYSIDNFRVDESAACTEHEFVDVEGTYFKVSDATCQAPKTYKKSCNICGAAGTETFTVGETVAHSYSEATCAVKPTCTVCGTVDESAELLPHNYQNVPYAYAIKTQATDKSPAVYYQSCAACKSVNEEVTFTFGKTEPYYNGVPTTPYANGFGVNSFTADTSAAIGIFLANDGDNYFVRYYEKDASTIPFDFYAPVTNGSITTYYYQYDIRIDGFSKIRDNNWPVTIKLMGTKADGSTGEVNSRAFDIFAYEGDTHAAFASGSNSGAADNYEFGTWATLTYKLVKGEEVSEGCFKWTVTLYVDGVQAAAAIANSKTVPKVRIEPRYSSGSKTNDMTMDMDNIISYYDHICDGSVTCVDNLCTVCGYLELTGEYTDHVYSYQNSAANLATPATATTPATYFVKCQDCGLATGDTFTDGYLVHDYDDGTLPSHYGAALTTEGVKDQYRIIMEDESGNKFFRLGKTGGGESIVYWNVPVGDGIIANNLWFDFKWNGGTIPSSGDKGAGYVKAYAADGKTGYINTSLSCSGTGADLSLFGTTFKVGDWYRINVQFNYNDAGGTSVIIDVYNAAGELVKDNFSLGSTIARVAMITIHPRSSWTNISFDYDNAYLVTEHNCNDCASAIANNAALKGETADGAEFYQSCSICGRVLVDPAVVNGGVYAVGVKPAIPDMSFSNPSVAAPEADANEDGIADGVYWMALSEKVTNIRGEEVDNTFLRYVKNNATGGVQWSFAPTREDGKDTYVVEFDFRWQGAVSVQDPGSNDGRNGIYNYAVGGKKGFYGTISTDLKSIYMHKVTLGEGDWHKFTYTYVWDEANQNYKVTAAIDGVVKETFVGTSIGFAWEMRWSNLFSFTFDVDNFTYTAK